MEFREYFLRIPSLLLWYHCATICDLSVNVGDLTRRSNLFNKKKISLISWYSMSFIKMDSYEE